MTSWQFPVVKGTPCHWPVEATCPVCGRNKVLEPHSMAIVTAGALLTGREKDAGTMSDALDGFLSLTWHCAHDGGSGAQREAHCTVYVIDEAFGGQGELYFCSTGCLREFLNGCVDELERRIEASEGEQRDE